MCRSKNLTGAVLALGTCLFWAAAWGGGLPAKAADAPAADAQQPAEQVGQTIRITLPLDDQVVSRVQRSVRQVLARAERSGARPVLIFEFDVPRGAAEGGRGSEFDEAHKLAAFLSGEQLNAATTVAYLPQSIQGHAVLVALACDQIIMAAGATIGKAGVDEKVVDETQLIAYREIAGRRRTLPVEVAVGMLRPAQDVLLVHTEASTEYVTPAGLEELRQRHTIQSQKVLIRKDEPGQFSGAELRELGFVKRLAANRLEVVRALGLPPSAVAEDPSRGDPWRAVRVDLKGIVDKKKVDQAVRMIQDEIRLRDVNFVCLWIDSPGGSPSESLRLAQFLVDIDPSAVRTVAYIPEAARADATLPVLACDQVVMHPGAVLGGPGEYQMSEDEIKFVGKNVREMATKKLRSWSLWNAMLDPQLEVFRCTRLGEEEFFCDEELAAQQPQPGAGGNLPRWRKGPLETIPNVAFRTGGTKAVEFHLADHTVENLAQFKKLYDLENDPTLVEPSWADLLIESLLSPGVTALLLVLGGVGLYVELHVPGIGVGGFLAAVCFLLFFWGHYLPGSPFWLEITLFLAGIACLLVEVFVLPGLVIFGLGGGAMVLISLVLASQTFVLPRNEYQVEKLEHTLLSIAGAGVGLIAACAVLRRWLPRAPAYRHMVLEPPAGEEARTISRHETRADLESLLGSQGVTTTQLSPAGKARFGNTLVDVISGGDFIPRNTPVTVAEVHGNRVLVRPVDNG